MHMYTHDTRIEEKGRSEERKKMKLPAESTGRETQEKNLPLGRL